MSDPTFYWYGRGSARLIKTSAIVSDVQVSVVRDRSGASPIGGMPVSVDHGAKIVVDITLDKATLPEHPRLFSMIEHLRRGGAVGFAVDPETVQMGWALSPSGGLAAGSTSMLLSGTAQLAAWESSGAIASGTRMLVSSPAPACEHVVATASGAVSSGLLGLSDGLPERLSEGFVAVRPWGLFPVLVMDPEQAGDGRMSSDRELYYDVTLRLTEYPAHLAALRGVTLGSTTTPHVAPFARSLMQAVGREAPAGATLAAPSLLAGARRFG